jgi:ribonuclease HI
MRMLKIFVGAYVNDPKADVSRVGAYGVVIEENGTTRELSACHWPTTKHRIRLSAITAALNTLSELCEATVYVDSEYIVNGINKGWAKSWRRRNWRISNCEKAKNADLWDKLLTLTEKHDLDFVWVRNHNGYEYGAVYNARCDEMAINAVKTGGP